MIKKTIIRKTVKMAIPISIIVFLIIFYNSFYLTHQTKEIVNENDIPEWSYLDFTVDPCSNFYDFTCGNFKKSHPRPENVNILSHFELLQADLIQIAKNILDAPRFVIEPIALNKAKLFYKVCSDTSLVNLQLVPELATIDEFGGMPLLSPYNTNFSWSILAEMVANYGIQLIFSIDVLPYDGNTTYIVLRKDPLVNPALLKPSDDSYDSLLEKDLKTHFSAKKETPLQPFDVFLQSLAKKLLKIVNPSKTDNEMLQDLELMSDFMRDFYQINNYTGYINEQIGASPTLGALQKWTITQFGEPIIHWVDFLSIIFKPAGVEITETTNLYLGIDLKELYGILNLVKNTKSAIIKNFAFFRIFLFQAPDSDYTTRLAFEEYYHAKNYTLYPRWEYCTRKVLGLTDTAALDFAVTYAYQLESYDVTRLNKVMHLIRVLRRNFVQLIETNDWLDRKSAEKVTEKLRNMLILLAYPDMVANAEKIDKFYANLVVYNWNNYANAKNLRAFKQAYQYSQLAALNPRQFWSRSTFDVNAVNNRPNNRITIPIALLNPAFYSGNNSVLDYARIGFIVGHEMTHGFDTAGIGYDANALKNSLFNGETLQDYNYRLNCFINQYNKYNVARVNASVNGNNCLNENIADNNGIRLAFNAFTDLLQAGDLVTDSQQFTIQQLFFIAFGTGWCSDESDSYLGALLTQGVYPPNKYRVVGALSNMAEFGRAFNCSKSVPMSPIGQCRLW